MLSNSPAASAPQLIKRIWQSCYWWLRNRTAKIESSPILIGGNQKAGTTAIAGMLAACINESFTNDIFYRIDGLEKKLLLKEANFELVKRKLACWLESKVIKDPSLFFMREEVETHFTDCKWVFVVRDPRNNIRSMLNRLEIPGDLEQLTQIHRTKIEQTPGWVPVFEGTGLGGPGENYIQTLATRWSRSVECYLRFQNESLLVKYEDFCENKSGVIEKLAIDLGFTPVAQTKHLHDHQFQPKGNSTSTHLEFFGKENLKIIESTCILNMSPIGYEL